MFDKLKSWAEGEYAAVKGAVSAEVSEFIVWAEGKQALEDAEKLLEQHGYTVTPPPSAAQPPPAPPWPSGSGLAVLASMLTNPVGGRD